MIARLSALFISTILLAGCGYVGDPLPPALNIATRITDLRAVQRGDKITIQFTVPELTTEGLVIRKLGQVDLRIGSIDAPFQMNRWEAEAKALDTASIVKPGPATLTVPSREWTGTSPVVGVRIVNTRGRPSEWSNTVVLRIVPPIPPPAEVKAEPHPTGVRLTWKGASSTQYRIFRQGEQDQAPVESGTSAEPEYIDSTAALGKSYKYTVEGYQGESRSELSAVVSIVPTDVFPPAVPSGLQALAGVNSVELAWQRSTDADLQGYRVYRAGPDGKMDILAALIESPAYSDKQVESGKSYKYTVSALDRANNESQQSAAIEIKAP